MKNKKLFFCVVVLFLIVFIGCDNFTNLNTRSDEVSTNNLSKQSLGKLFAKAEYSGYFPSFQTGQNLFSDLYAQYYATDVNYFSTDVFDFVGSWENGKWTGFYANAAPQIKLVLDYTSKHNMAVENAATKVWKVLVYDRVTDYYGPIIYSNFGNEKKVVDYDSQESIYDSFFKELDDAVKILKSNLGSSVFEGDDLIYGHDGNVVQWLRLANSLRLKLALRICYVEPSKAESEAEKAMNSPKGVIENNSDNALMSFNPPESDSPLSHIVSYGTHGEFRMSSAMISALKGYNDPRLGAYVNPANDGGGYHGLRNGLSQSERGALNIAKYSTIAKRFYPVSAGGDNVSWPVMTASEVYFNRAEGALRGWADMGATAKELYNKGIKRSLQFITDASGTEMDQYINNKKKPIALNDKWNSPPVFNVPVKFETNSNFQTKLEQIISQKWLALFPDGFEAWTDRRRTGYPKLYPVIMSKNPNVGVNDIVRRMEFVATEYQTNNEAVEKAIQLLNNKKDTHMTRVWWNKK